LAGPALASASALAIGFAVAGALGRGPDAADHRNVQFRNPFGFWAVVGFAVVLAVVIVLGRMIGERFGGTGAIVGAVFVGLADVDSITVSMARLTPGPLSAESAAIAILAAIASNTVSKIAIGAVVGRGRFAYLITVMALACLIAGAAALAATLALAQH
jgi:uncharacterized membrane protein (DUF4010 family)